MAINKNPKGARKNNFNSKLSEFSIMIPIRTKKNEPSKKNIKGKELNKHPVEITNTFDSG